MTPRRIEAMLFIASKRKAMEEVAALNIAALGSRGDEKAVKQFAKDRAP